MALTQEQIAAVTNRVNILVPETTEQAALLGQLIQDAGDFVESYTGRNSVPDALVRTVGDLVIIAYNRRGTEGESARSEGGENYTFETAPAQIYDVLNRFRLARVGGVIYATEADQT